MKVNSAWRKPSRSGPAGNCVRVRRDGDMIEVGDDKDPTGQPLRFTVAEWVAFTAAVKDNEFEA